tara:strand:- start:119 stop:451 length:333 start_codon:yes stop_codon:yes gene_type:complete
MMETEGPHHLISVGLRVRLTDPSDLNPQKKPMEASIPPYIRQTNNSPVAGPMTEFSVGPTLYTRPKKPMKEPIKASGTPRSLNIKDQWTLALICIATHAIIKGRMTNVRL